MSPTNALIKTREIVRDSLVAILAESAVKLGKLSGIITVGSYVNHGIKHSHYMSG